jgi:hypothetical protein
VSGVLVVNAGSSSLKVSVLNAGDQVTAALDLDHWDGRPDHRELADFITGRRGGIAVAGHRVVHGGSRYTGPVLIDDSVLAGIAGLTDLAPLHQPRALAGIEAVSRMLPSVAPRRRLGQSRSAPGARTLGLPPAPAPRDQRPARRDPKCPARRPGRRERLNAGTPE